MTETILAGFDPLARDAAPVDFGAVLAELTGARLVVASVQAGAAVLPIAAGQSLNYGVRRPDADLPHDCAEALGNVEVRLRERGVAYECRALRSLSAARGLQEEAEAENAALLVVGAGRPPGMERVVLGSTSERLLGGAPCPVATVPHGWQKDALRTIGVGYIDTAEGQAALRVAHALAYRAGASLRVITVLHVTPGMLAETEAGTGWRPGKSLDAVEGEHRAMAERELRERVAELGDDIAIQADVLVGDAADVLVELSAHFDLLVCGARGYGPLRAVLLGGVSRRVAVEARCPVIVLPRGEYAPLEALLAEAHAAR
jgi:nucleotide-binding universal stress UspA family protein